jgi:hypothetical protein
MLPSKLMHKGLLGLAWRMSKPSRRRNPWGSLIFGSRPSPQCHGRFERLTGCEHGAGLPALH